MLRRAERELGRGGGIAIKMHFYDGTNELRVLLRVSLRVGQRARWKPSGDRVTCARNGNGRISSAFFRSLHTSGTPSGASDVFGSLVIANNLERFVLKGTRGKPGRWLVISFRYSCKAPMGR